MNSVERYYCNTGETEDIARRIDAFWLEIRDAIADPCPDPLFVYSIDVAEHASNIGDIHRAIWLDGRTTIMLYKDRIVGTVIERRTEFNYIEFVFAKYLDDLDELRSRLPTRQSLYSK